MKFGKFDSFEAFLASYIAARRVDDLAETAGLPEDAALARRRRRRARDVVELRSRVLEYLGTESAGAQHQHLIINVTELLENDPDVADDLARVIEAQERVFVSIRFGDRMGIPDEVPGLVEGVSLRLRGEWIPREEAYAHGGERLSVLHFTHDPLGFVCTPAACYS